MYGARSDKAMMTNTAPNPYTGLIGPFRNPRFMKCLARIEQNEVSHTHPRKLYMINQRKRVIISDINSFVCCKNYNN